MKRLLIILALLTILLSGCVTDPAYVEVLDDTPVDVDVTNDPLNVNLTEIDDNASIIVKGDYDDGTFGHLYIDTIDNSLICISMEHHQIHERHSFTVTDTVQADTTNVTWMINTTKGTEYPHMLFTMSCTGEANYRVTEGSDRTPGTDLPAINRWRTTPSAAVTGVSRTPTGGTTDGAVILFNVRSGATGVASKTIEGGTARSESEFVLALDTKYVITVTTYADVFVTMKLDWYEHEE